MRTKTFEGSWIDEQLRECQKQGYRALFMPELADKRIKAKKDSNLWKNWYTTPSIRATGRTKQGNPVVVYVHTDNYFSNPDNVKQAREFGLVNGAGIIPQSEFQKYLDSEDNKNVFVIDYDKLRKSSSKVISVENALEHPQTVPFLGGEEIAQKYLERHKQVYGNKIGIWHSDDLKNEPLGRLLYLGGSYGSGFSGSTLNGIARFFGVRESAEGTSQKILSPKLEQILKVAKPFIPKIVEKEFAEELKKLYK